MNVVEMNPVSECCHKEIVTKHGREFPIAGVPWGIPTKEPVCIGCGMETSPVYACGICGTVGCNGLGGCEE